MKQIKRTCVYYNLDLTEYQTAWKLQKLLAENRLQQKIPDVLLFTEHPHTITMGKSGQAENLLISPSQMTGKGIAFEEVDRGGDVTYHGPGQVVAYPILNLSQIREDVIWYLRQLEEVIIRTLARFRISAARKEKYTGVWVGEEKIAAIGVKVSRWITTHGLALNVCPDLSYYDYIIPCGIRNKNVTSMVRLMKKDVTPGQVIPKMVNQFADVFQFRMMPYNHASWPVLSELLKENGIYY